MKIAVLFFSVFCLTFSIAVVEGSEFQFQKCSKCMRKCVVDKCLGQADTCSFPPLGLKADGILTPFSDRVEDGDFTRNYFATFNDESADPFHGVQPLSTFVDFFVPEYAAFKYPGIFDFLNGGTVFHPVEEWQTLHDFCRTACANQTFGYLAWGSTDRDPVRWNGDCQTGKRQSPIDIPAQCEAERNAAKSNGSLEFFGYENTFTKYGMKNDGKTINFYLEPETVGKLYITLDGVRYNTSQWHFHWPSEHAIGGRRGLIEKHLIHVGPNGKLVVLGFISVLAKDNDTSLLYPNWAPMAQAIQEADLNEPGSDLDFDKIRPEIDPSVLLVNSSYYRYEGSLTTPTCQEIVTWLVSTQITTISEESWKVFRNMKRCPTTNSTFNGTTVVTVDNLLWGNARSVQPINGRDVGILHFSPHD